MSSRFLNFFPRLTISVTKSSRHLFKCVVKYGQITSSFHIPHIFIHLSSRRQGGSSIRRAAYGQDLTKDLTITSMPPERRQPHDHQFRQSRSQQLSDFVRGRIYPDRHGLRRRIPSFSQTTEKALHRSAGNSIHLSDACSRRSRRLFLTTFCL